MTWLGFRNQFCINYCYNLNLKKACTICSFIVLQPDSSLSFKTHFFKASKSFPMPQEIDLWMGVNIYVWSVNIFMSATVLAASSRLIWSLLQQEFNSSVLPANEYSFFSYMHWSFFKLGESSLKILSGRTEWQKRHTLLSRNKHYRCEVIKKRKQNFSFLNQLKSRKLRLKPVPWQRENRS